MKLSRTMWILGLLLVLTPLAHADGTTTMLFTGVNGANNGVYYVSPYTGIMNYGTSNAQTVGLFCDDINNDVYIGEVWTANVTNMASGNLSNTRYGSTTDGNPNYTNAANALQLYEEAAWLVSQFGSHTSDYVSLQYALWDLMSPGAEPTSYSESGVSVSQWLSLAAKDYGQINPANFEIITNVGPLAYRGQVQEFIVETPEPATVVLLLIGIGAMFLLALKRQRQQVAA
ncbi:MAG: PEP-CTERM sorting domain-containing protein [Candidatus Acidiferrum sp.]|jgi:PEP-CTERM motif-containing protein